MYHLRLTIPRNDALIRKVLDVPEIVQRTCTYKLNKVLCGFETSKDGVEHYHAHIETDYKRVAFRRYLCKNFNVQGNEQISLSEVNKKESNEKYVIKEKDCILYRGYEKEEVEQIMSKWQVYRKSPAQTTKRNIKTVVQKIFEQYSGKCDEREIGRFVLEYYVQNWKMFPSDYQLKGIIGCIYSKTLEKIHEAQNLKIEKEKYYDKVLDRVLCDW